MNDCSLISKPEGGQAFCPRVLGGCAPAARPCHPADRIRTEIAEVSEDAESKNHQIFANAGRQGWLDRGYVEGTPRPPNLRALCALAGLDASPGAAQ